VLLPFFLAAGCGGGDAVTTAVPDTPAPVASRIVGTAATGAALANASVTVTNGSGGSPCSETAIGTNALGSYTCTLKEGERAPFFVVVVDPAGNSTPLVSVATETPAAGSTVTLNATSLTTAIVAQLASDGNALSVASSGNIDAVALRDLTGKVVAQLAAVLAAIGAPSNYDPFSTGITAATAVGAGNTADLVLDVVKVVTDPATGRLALATIADPTPIVLASASLAGAALPAPHSSVSTLAQAAQIATKAFRDCFAMATGERVLSKNTNLTANEGGPEVVQVGTACQKLVADKGNEAGIEFLHNGYRAGQLFYSILTSDGMTGAQFSVPEIMAFYPKDSTVSPPVLQAYDRAVLNIRYLDAAGNPGNQIIVAARIPGSSSSARPTDWWLVGNHDPVDVTLRLNIRRIEQVNPAAASRGNFQNGMGVAINPIGPGSVLNGRNLAMARMSGPGLPGLVFKRSSDLALNVLDLFNKSGNLTGSELACAGLVPSNCPLIWFSKTKGITGADAKTVGDQPGNLLWAQPADGIDATRFVKGARYKVELFYGTNTGTADRVLFKTLLSDVVQVTQGVNLPWNTLGPRSLSAFDPTGPLAGAQNALTVDWVQKPTAQQIDAVWPVVNGAFLPPTLAPRGARSAVLTSTLPAFTSTSNRSFAFRYRTLDGSGKTAVYTYN
jgi:hypothetical protein